MGHSVRKSRSIIGITFEDQVSVINKSASVEERLLQIATASWSAASRLVQQEYDSQEASDDNPQADLVDHVRNTVARKPLMTSNTLIQMKEFVSQMASEAVKSSGQQSAKIIPPRLKKLNKALEITLAESNQWRDLHHARKNKFNVARMERKQVLNGERVVNNKDRDSLPKSEDAWLRGLSDGQAEWNQIKIQEKRLVMAKNELLSQMARKRKALHESENDLETKAKKLRMHSEEAMINTKVNKQLSVPLPTEADFSWNGHPSSVSNNVN
jgi:hypothetical protein